jgi:hypothetical protein
MDFKTVLTFHLALVIVGLLAAMSFFMKSKLLNISGTHATTW